MPCSKLMPSSGEDARTKNWQVKACTQTTFCCVYPDGASQDCCQDSSRVFDAGPASYVSGESIVTSLFPSTMTSSSSSSAASTDPATTTGASSLMTTTPSPDYGLSTGAKAGIGVGATVGGLALIGIGVWLFMFLKKRKGSEHIYSAPFHEKANEEEPYRYPRYEAPESCTDRYEIMTQKRGDADNRAELSA